MHSGHRNLQLMLPVFFFSSPSFDLCWRVFLLFSTPFCPFRFQGILKYLIFVLLLGPLFIYLFIFVVYNNQNHKYFHNKPWFWIKWSFFLFSFLIKFQINFNSTLSHSSFNIKNTNQFLFATWLFTLKPFSKN